MNGIRHCFCLQTFLTAQQQLLGINIFTYILAAAIAFFLSMNAILGPGWLGNAIGILSGWDMTETSKSLPEVVDLSSKDYLL